MRHAYQVRLLDAGRFRQFRVQRYELVPGGLDDHHDLPGDRVIRLSSRLGPTAVDESFGVEGICPRTRSRILTSEWAFLIATGSG